LVTLCNRPGVLGAAYDVGAVLALGQMLRSLPFALATIAAVTMTLDRWLFDAAVLEGAGEATFAMRIAAPAIWPALVVSWLICGVVTLGELPATRILAPPGADPFSLRLFQLLHTGTANQQAALCLWTLAFAALAIMGALATARIVACSRAPRGERI
jgi:iron(III) transport system permease protein